MRMIIVEATQAASKSLLLGRSSVQYALGCGIRCGIEDIIVYGSVHEATAVPGISYVNHQGLLNLMVDADTDVVISRADIVYEYPALVELLRSTSDLCVAIGVAGRSAVSIANDTLTTSRLPINVAGVSGSSIGLLRLSSRCARVALDNNVVSTDALVRAALSSGLTVTLTILPRGWIDVGSPNLDEIIHGIEHDDPTAMLRRSLLGGSPVISAGGVARRQHQDCTEVLLVGDGNSGSWRIPKGMVEQNESIEAAALREVAEETGYQTRIEHYIGSAHWSYEYRGVPQEELVHFYSLTALTIANCRDTEHSSVAWHSLNDAIEALQYEEERAIVRKLRAVDRVEHGSTPRVCQTTDGGLTMICANSDRHVR